MLTCYCNDGLCTYCRSVMAMNIIAGHLFTAGEQSRGNELMNFAGRMDDELRASYQSRTQQRELFTEET